MKRRMQPYVGVSGVVSPEQQTELIEASYEALSLLGHRLALGVKATHVTQYEDRVDGRGVLWQPVGTDIEQAVDGRRETMVIDQMSLRPDLVVSDPDYPKRFVDTLITRTGNYVDAMQVDSWRYERTPEAFTRIIRAMAGKGVYKIIQCNTNSGSSPQKALDTIKRLTDGYEINYILFEASHGSGRELNPDVLLPYLNAAYSDPDFDTPMINFGIAGGLDGSNVIPLLDRILAEHNDISWDSEARLHNPISLGGDGSLDMTKATAYLDASSEVLLRHT